MAGIELGQGLNIRSANPADMRMVKKTYAEMLAIDTPFDGLTCWVSSEQKEYRCHAVGDTFEWREATLSGNFLPLVDDLESYEAEVGTMVEYGGESNDKYTKGYHYIKDDTTWDEFRRYIELSEGRLYETEADEPLTVSRISNANNEQMLWFLGDAPVVGASVVLALVNTATRTFSHVTPVTVTSVKAITGGWSVKVTGPYSGEIASAVYTSQITTIFTNDTKSRYLLENIPREPSSGALFSAIRSSSGALSIGITNYVYSEVVQHHEIGWVRYNTQPGGADSTDYSALIRSKLDKNQGKENGNKVLITNPDGTITTVPGLVLSVEDKAKLDSITNPLKLKGVLESESELEKITDAEEGDVYYITSENEGGEVSYIQYVRANGAWAILGKSNQLVDISNLVTKDELAKNGNFLPQVADMQAYAAGCPVGRIVQYTGNNDEAKGYVNGYIYKKGAGQKVFSIGSTYVDLGAEEYKSLDLGFADRNKYYFDDSAFEKPLGIKLWYTEDGKALYFVPEVGSYATLFNGSRYVRVKVLEIQEHNIILSDGTNFICAVSADTYESQIVGEYVNENGNKLRFPRQLILLDFLEIFVSETYGVKEVIILTDTNLTRERSTEETTIGEPDWYRINVQPAGDVSEEALERAILQAKRYTDSQIEIVNETIAAIDKHTQNTDTALDVDAVVCEPNLVTVNRKTLAADEISANILNVETIKKVTTEEVETENDFILLRKGASSALPTNKVSGVEVENYNGTNNARFAIANDGTFRIGDVGDERPVLLRAESRFLLNGQKLIWNARTLSAETSNDEIDMTYSAYMRLPESQRRKDATYWLYEEAQLTIKDIDGNGNDGVQTYSSGSNVTLTALVSEDRDFVGFYSDAEFKNSITKVVMLDDTIVYAKWSNTKTYEVKVVSSVDGATLSSVRVQKANTFAVPAHSEDAYIVGNYNFLNFKVNGSVIAEGTAIDVLSDITITATYTAKSEIDLGIVNLTARILFAPSVLTDYLAWGERTKKSSYTEETYTATTFEEPAAMPSGFRSLDDSAAALLIATRGKATHTWAVANNILTITNLANKDYLKLPLLGYMFGTDIVAQNSRACYNLASDTCKVLNVTATSAEIATNESAYLGRNIIAIKEVTL